MRGLQTAVHCLGVCFLQPLQLCPIGRSSKTHHRHGVRTVNARPKAFHLTSLGPCSLPLYRASFLPPNAPPLPTTHVLTGPPRARSSRTESCSTVRPRTGRARLAPPLLAGFAHTQAAHVPTPTQSHQIHCTPRHPACAAAAHALARAAFRRFAPPPMDDCGTWPSQQAASAH